MSRPTGWHVLDMGEDPTPGDPYRVRVLARSAGRMADDAADAHAAVRSLASDGAVLSWVGLAGDVFRGAIEDFPTQLAKLQDSYEQAAAALDSWASRLDDVQSTADRALEQGKQAQAEIDSLESMLAGARSQAASAAAASDRLADQGGSAPPPSPEQLRAATRSLDAAQDRVGSLSTSLSGAQSRLSAAKRMAEQARELKRSTARTVKQRLYDASDAGVQPKSRWEKFKEAAKRAWDITVKVATVVVAVLSVLALVMGGPLVWGVLFALSALLLADSLAKYARGEGSLFDVGLNMLGVIPGGRLLGAAGRLVGRSAQGARGLAAGSRALSAGRNALRGMTASVRQALRRGLPQLPRRMPRDAFGNRIPVPYDGQTVYRVFGTTEDGAGNLLPAGSRPFGESWTHLDPRTSRDFRVEAGLPDENPSRFYVEGVLRDPRAVSEVRPALPLDGNPGGWPEYLIREADRHVDVVRVGGVNETWTTRPGAWTPPPAGGAP